MVDILLSKFIFYLKKTKVTRVYAKYLHTVGGFGQIRIIIGQLGHHKPI